MSNWHGLDRKTPCYHRILQTRQQLILMRMEIKEIFEGILRYITVREILAM
jgi:hypothetical protein